MWNRDVSRDDPQGAHPEGARGAAATPLGYRFGPWEIDLGRRRLLREGVEVPLQPQPFRALCLLAEAEGGVVSPETFVSELWEPGTHVDFERAIISTVRRLRDALGDTAADAQWIATVPGHGYRLLPEIEVISASAPPTGRAVPGWARPDSWPRPLTLTAGLALAAFVAVVLVGMTIHVDTHRTVAVLPFEGASQDPVERDLAASLTDEISVRLAARADTGLRVAAPHLAARLAGAEMTLEESRDEHGVDLLLRGSLHRRGTALRLHLQLICAHSEEIVWAAMYWDESGIGYFGADTALQVAEAVRAQNMRQSNPPLNSLLVR